MSNPFEQSKPGNMSSSPAAKPAPKPEAKKGLFGQGEFKTFQQVERFVKKPDVAPPSGYGGMWTKEKRVSFGKDLEKFGKTIGKTSGVSQSDIPYIIRKMQDAKASTQSWPEKKKIDDDIKMLRYYMQEGK